MVSCLRENQTPNSVMPIRYPKMMTRSMGFISFSQPINQDSGESRHQEQRWIVDRPVRLRHFITGDRDGDAAARVVDNSDITAQRIERA